MSLPLSNYEVAFEQRQIGCGSLRQLPINAAVIGELDFTLPVREPQDDPTCRGQSAQIPTEQEQED
jgi:hypothetical protein